MSQLLVFFIKLSVYLSACLSIYQSIYPSNLRMTMSILEMCHQRKPFPLQSITARPQARNILALKVYRTVLRYGVSLHLFGRLERLHTASPLAQKRLRRVNLNGRLLLRSRGRIWRRGLADGRRCWAGRRR